MDPNCTWNCFKKLRNTNIPIQPREIHNLKLVIFDMDGVLADIQGSWRKIHHHYHTDNNSNVDNYLDGTLTDEEFIASDINQWKKPDGTLPNIQEIKNIYRNAPIMKGAKELISFLQKNKITTAIVSAGVDILAHQIQQQLNIDLCYANTLNVDSNNQLDGTGTVNVPLCHKDKPIQKILIEKKLSAHQAISIGNSCFDLPMFYAVGIGIAFNPHDQCIKNEADQVITTKNLADLIPLIDSYLQNNQP